MKAKHKSGKNRPNCKRGKIVLMQVSAKDGTKVIVPTRHITYH